MCVGEGGKIQFDEYGDLKAHPTSYDYVKYGPTGNLVTFVPAALAKTTVEGH